MIIRDNYSNIALYKVNHSLNNGYAFSIILMNNVCYEIGTNNLSIYTNDQENILMIAIDIIICHSFLVSTSPFLFSTKELKIHQFHLSIM